MDPCISWNSFAVQPSFSLVALQSWPWPRRQPVKLLPSPLVQKPPRPEASFPLQSSPFNFTVPSPWSSSVSPSSSDKSLKPFLIVQFLLPSSSKLTVERASRFQFWCHKQHKHHH
ncbi:hypothetical protein MUK42_34324 [Musa troglodytarum]|uniref:Uncharacterized protein n=1 Tax=Musa troglodytarum TaxID=320322 RepID=A0A9E7JU19_9LILI|nr:hypothetical protein MUK42_34324 [Musa troglodytarum]